MSSQPTLTLNYGNYFFCGVSFRVFLESMQGKHLLNYLPQHAGHVARYHSELFTTAGIGQRIKATRDCMNGCCFIDRRTDRECFDASSVTAHYLRTLQITEIILLHQLRDWESVLTYGLEPR